MKNAKLKIKNGSLDDGFGFKKSPMNSGQSAGQAVSRGSAEIAGAGVGSVPGAEGEMEEIGEKADKNEVSSADAEALADKGFEFLVSSGEIKNEIVKSKNLEGGNGKHLFRRREDAMAGQAPALVPTTAPREEGDDCAAGCVGQVESTPADGRVQYSAETEDGEAPLPVPPPAPRARGEGDESAAGYVGRVEQDSAAWSSGDGSAGAEGVGIGNLKLQISREDMGNCENVECGSVFSPMELAAGKPPEPAAPKGFGGMSAPRNGRTRLVTAAAADLYHGEEENGENTENTEEKSG